MSKLLEIIYIDELRKKNDELNRRLADLEAWKAAIVDQLIDPRPPKHAMIKEDK